MFLSSLIARSEIVLKTPSTSLNEIPAALENFNKNGRPFKEMYGYGLDGYGVGYQYYKFKALKPSYNEITLKFNYIDSSLLKVENTTKYIKVNILAKK